MSLINSPDSRTTPVAESEIIRNATSVWDGFGIWLQSWVVRLLRYRYKFRTGGTFLTFRLLLVN